MSNLSNTGYCGECGTPHPKTEHYCTNCGHQLPWAQDIKSPPLLEEMDLTIGNMICNGGTIKVSLHISSTGYGSIVMYAHDSDLRRSGVYMRTDHHGLERLKRLVEKAEQVVEQAKSTGHLLKLQI